MVRHILVLSLLVGLCPAFGLAQETGITRKQHAWGSFSPGAWKLVRVITETLDAKGEVESASTSETKTTLLAVDAGGVTLLIEAIVEVAGKRFDGEPQTVKQSFYGELASRKITAKSLKPVQVVIEGRKIPCNVQQLEFSNSTGKTLTTIYHAENVAPFILKRESKTTDPEGKTTLSETSVNVIALDMPCKVLAEIKTAAYVKAVQKTAKGTVVTLAITSPDVPGGIISHASKEIDKNGRPVRRSILELTDYGDESDSERPGLFRRGRTVRPRKTTRYSPY